MVEVVEKSKSKGNVHFLEGGRYLPSELCWCVTLACACSTEFSLELESDVVEALVISARPVFFVGGAKGSAGLHLRLTETFDARVHPHLSQCATPIGEKRVIGLGKYGEGR